MQYHEYFTVYALHTLKMFMILHELTVAHYAFTMTFPCNTSELNHQKVARNYSRVFHLGLKDDIGRTYHYSTLPLH